MERTFTGVNKHVMWVVKLDDCVNLLVQNLQLKGRSPYWNS